MVFDRLKAVFGGKRLYLSLCLVTIASASVSISI